MSKLRHPDGREERLRLKREHEKKRKQVSSSIRRIKDHVREEEAEDELKEFAT